VIGLATTTGQNQPTREGYVIPSEGFAQIFLRQFQDRWEEAVGYDDGFKDVRYFSKFHFWCPCDFCSSLHRIVHTNCGCKRCRKNENPHGFLLRNYVLVLC